MFISDFVRGRDSLRGPLASLNICGKHSSERITRLHAIAYLNLRDKSDRWIDLIFDAHAPAAGFGNCISNLFRVDFDDKTGARGFYLKRVLCQRQNLRGFVADARVAALRFDIRAETLQGGA